jgi:hypothetical protein
MENSLKTQLLTLLHPLHALYEVPCAAQSRILVYYSSGPACGGGVWLYTVARYRYGQKMGCFWCCLGVGEGWSACGQYGCDRGPQAHTGIPLVCKVAPPNPESPGEPAGACVRWMQMLLAHLRAQSVRDACAPKIVQPPEPMRVIPHYMMN